MSTRIRLILGLSSALVIGALGPAMMAVAGHSGSGTSTISGRITVDGHPERKQCASAWFSRENRAAPQEIFAGSAIADTNGNYTLGRLPADVYKVEFHHCDARRVGGFRVTEPWRGTSSRYWPDSALYETADEIVVGTAEAITGIDSE